jgi:hypothetical protein
MKSILAVLVLIGLSFASMTPDIWQQRVINGLKPIALGERVIPSIPASEAQDILLKWFNVKVTCTEPTEKMWLSYCQQFYVAEGGDCSAATPENKARIMANMRVCRITR